MKGIIALWSGAVVDIPFGWKLCDGNNGTPDLRDKFVQGAGGSLNPDDTGGATLHRHTVDMGAHNHPIPTNGPIQAGGGYSDTVSATQLNVQSNLGGNPPPFYALAYIMHI